MITQLVLNLFRRILFIFIINIILISANQNPCHPIEKSFSELDGSSQVSFLGRFVNLILVLDSGWYTYIDLAGLAIIWGPPVFENFSLGKARETQKCYGL